MPITAEVRTLLDSRDALRELAELSIPIRTALKARKVYKAVQSEIETIQEQIKALTEKHAKRDEAGEMVHPMVKSGTTEVPNEDAVEIADRKAYAADMEELLGTEVTLTFDKIKEADLEDIPKPTPGRPAGPEHESKLKLKISTVFALDWLLED